MIRRAARDRSEGGSVSVEVAILAPVFILLLGLAVVAGRATVARNVIDAAAHDAARAASIARTHEQALADGEQAVEDLLAEQGLNCVPAASVTLAGRLPGAQPTDPAISLVDAFDSDRVGNLVFVVATVSCTVSYADLGLPGFPGSVGIERSFVSPIDRFRGRSLGMAPIGAVTPPGTSSGGGL
ncbi:TadE/TadG family type IV pilus assembly protein [Plantactinospora sp. GCM10030261]|uniref:TadE/TadG family type IV pilus assembly protein n=1 Tax=Plantactinospora sp. GCM10030261 TaxID=3273420 RepID=UPI0036153269